MYSQSIKSFKNHTLLKLSVENWNIHRKINKSFPHNIPCSRCPDKVFQDKSSKFASTDVTTAFACTFFFFNKFFVVVRRNAMYNNVLSHHIYIHLIYATQTRM